MDCILIKGRVQGTYPPEDKISLRARFVLPRITANFLKSVKITYSDRVEFLKIRNMLIVRSPQTFPYGTFDYWRNLSKEGLYVTPSLKFSRT